jgi:hypothetical protein
LGNSCDDHRRSILALELAARSDANEDQPVVGRVQHPVRAPVIITRPAHEDLRLALDFLGVVQHSALKLPVGRTPRFRRVDVTHEEEVPEEKEPDEDNGEPEQRFLEKAKRAVKSLRLFHFGSV